jgi:hypothetical protein
MRRVWLSRIAVTVTGIFMVLLFASTGVARAATTTLVASFAGGDLGEGTVVQDKFGFVGSESLGSPSQVTGLTVHLPAGVGGSRIGFAECTVSTLDVAGPSGCPPGSLAGPAGSVTLRDTIGGEPVEELGTVQAIFGSGESLNFYLNAPSPLDVQVPLTGTYTYSAQSGHVLTVTPLLIESVPGAPPDSITSLTLAVGAARREGGSEVHSVTIPQECPPGGFTWLANATFADGTTTNVTYKSPCPPPSTAAPILAQRQAVQVTAGVVTVRLKGTSSFVPLPPTSAIPNGSELDTIGGRALITAAAATSGQTDSAEVFGGTALIDQDANTAMTRLLLSQPLTGCPGARPPRRGLAASAVAAKHRSGSKSRHLWVSDGGGNWGTSGRYVSTTVEGTRWLTLDECRRSRVTVAAGEVKVHDLIHHRTRLLSAGETYIAARGSSRRP